MKASTRRRDTSPKGLNTRETKYTSMGSLHTSPNTTRRPAARCTNHMGSNTATGRRVGTPTSITTTYPRVYPPSLPHSPSHTPSPSNPPPTPYMRDAQCSNHRGHVTASQHVYVSNNWHNNNKTRGFERDRLYEHKGPVYHNMRKADEAFPRPQLVYHEETGEYVHPCFLTPAQIAHHHNTLEHPTPISPSPLTSTPPLPQPTPPAHVTSPSLNEQGHVSVSTDYPATTPSVNYTYLKTLCHDCERETPSALSWIDGFYNLVDVIEEDQENWKADKQARICENHWIQYPKRNYYATPHLWDPANKHQIPCIIEKSRPLYPALKRRHYKNRQHKRYPNPWPQSQSLPQSPSPELEQHYSGDNNITPHTPSPPSMCSNSYHTNNNISEPPYGVDARTTPPHSAS